MKVSVVMATYNGEGYIYEQMLSICHQTMPPDEVVIFDDCSKDQTVAVIRDFIESHGLGNWKLTVNQENKGWMRNFTEALKEAQGDYIFFSDQDDIWLEDKIEVMTSFMEGNPEIACLTGKVIMADSNGTALAEEDASAEATPGKLTRHRFSASFNTAVMPGCSMCVTKQLAEILTQANVTNCPYDEQCCRLGILLDGTYTLDRPVILHRLHAHNTSGFTQDVNFGSSSLQKRMESIANNIVWLERLSRVPGLQRLLDKRKKSCVRDTISFQKKRLEFLSGRNMLLFLRLLKYKKYYSGISMYLGDFSYAFHINRLAGRIRKRMKLSRKAKRK